MHVCIFTCMCTCVCICTCIYATCTAATVSTLIHISRSFIDPYIPKTQERKRSEEQTKRELAKRRAQREEELSREKDRLQSERRERLRAGFTNKSKFPISPVLRRRADFARTSEAEDSYGYSTNEHEHMHAYGGSPDGASRSSSRNLLGSRIGYVDAHVHESGAQTARGDMEGGGVWGNHGHLSAR
jgi:hypothetical protein